MFPQLRLLPHLAVCRRWGCCRNDDVGGGIAVASDVPAAWGVVIGYRYQGRDGHNNDDLKDET